MSYRDQLEEQLQKSVDQARIEMRDKVEEECGTAYYRLHRKMQIRGSSGNFSQAEQRTFGAAFLSYWTDLWDNTDGWTDEQLRTFTDMFNDMYFHYCNEHKLPLDKE